jgi:hypothetical protein
VLLAVYQILTRPWKASPCAFAWTLAIAAIRHRAHRRRIVSIATDQTTVFARRNGIVPPAGR